MISLPPKYFVDSAGQYLGAFVGVQKEIPVFSEPRFREGKDGKQHEVPPEVIRWDLGDIEQPMPDDPGAIEVPLPPADGRDLWNGEAWVSYAPAPIDLDAELAKRNPWIRALVELIPGGVDAVKAKVEELKSKEAGADQKAG